MKTEEIIVDEILRDHFKIEKGIPTFIPDDVTPEEIIRLIIDYNKANKPLKQSEQRNPDGYVYLNPHHDNNYFYKQKPDNLAVQPVYFAPPVPASDLKDLKDWDEVFINYSLQEAGLQSIPNLLKFIKSNYRLPVYFPVQRAEPDGWSRGYGHILYENEIEAIEQSGNKVKPVYFAPVKQEVKDFETVLMDYKDYCLGTKHADMWNSVIGFKNYLNSRYRLPVYLPDEDAVNSFPKKTEETDCAKLRNQLSPFYNIVSMIIKNDVRLVGFITKEAQQCEINKVEINRLLTSIESK